MMHDDTYKQWRFVYCSAVRQHYMITETNNRRSTVDCVPVFADGMNLNAVVRLRKCDLEPYEIPQDAFGRPKVGGKHLVD